MDLSQSVQFVKGVGPNRAELLHKLGIYTLEDIITYYPREYEDRGNLKKICELQIGEQSAFRATVVSRISETRIRNKMTIYKLLVREDNANKFNSKTHKLSLSGLKYNTAEINL